MIQLYQNDVHVVIVNVCGCVHAERNEFGCNCEPDMHANALMVSRQNKHGTLAQASTQKRVRCSSSEVEGYYTTFPLAELPEGPRLGRTKPLESRPLALLEMLDRLRFFGSSFSSLTGFPPDA